MYEVTYYSIAKQTITPGDIAAILTASREFNSRNEITGCLLYYRNQFIQILEGDKKVISGLLSRIEKDNRHDDIVVLAEGDKEERTFKDWTMAYHELSDDDVKDISDSLFINNFLAFSVLASKPTYTIKLFWSKAQRLLTNNYTT